MLFTGSILLGRPYVRLAFEGYYQGHFDKIQLADYLDIKPISSCLANTLFSGNLFR